MKNLFTTKSTNQNKLLSVESHLSKCFLKTFLYSQNLHQANSELAWNGHTCLKEMGIESKCLVEYTQYICLFRLIVLSFIDEREREKVKRERERGSEYEKSNIINKDIIIIFKASSFRKLGEKESCLL